MSPLRHLQKTHKNHTHVLIILLRKAKRDKNILMNTKNVHILKLHTLAFVLEYLGNYLEKKS